MDSILVSRDLALIQQIYKSCFWMFGETLLTCATWNPPRSASWTFWQRIQWRMKWAIWHLWRQGHRGGISHYITWSLWHLWPEMREPWVICSLHGMKRIMIDQLLYSILFFLDLHSPKTCMDTTNHRKLRGNDFEGRSFSKKNPPIIQGILEGWRGRWWFLRKVQIPSPWMLFLFVVFRVALQKDGKLILWS